MNLLHATVLAAVLASPALAQETPPAAKGSATAGAAGQDVFWAETWPKALESAKKMRNGRILVLLGEEDCGDCQRMEALILPSTSFFSFTRDKVPVRLDWREGDGKMLAERFGVPNVPAWLVVTPDLVVSGFQSGVISQQGWFETFTATERSWGGYLKMLADEQADPSNSEVVFAVAQETFKRRGDSLAEPRFTRLSKDARTPPALKDQSLAYLATIQLDSNRPNEAAKTLDTLLATSKDPKLLERAELSRAEVEIALGRKDVAVKKLEEFRAKHPASPLAKDAEELLKRLGGSL